MIKVVNIATMNVRLCTIKACIKGSDHTKYEAQTHDSFFHLCSQCPKIDFSSLS